MNLDETNKRVVTSHIPNMKKKYIFNAFQNLL